MSEFKYACPVCGQHIKCDASQAGARMTCPTCFQEIITPQAPASEDQKFILTGTKVGDRPAAKNPEPGPETVPTERPVPGVVVVLAIFLFIGLAVGFVYYGTIIKPLFHGKSIGKRTGVSQPASPVAVAPVTNAVAAGPPASDTNWMMDLSEVTIPSTPAAGRIHGQDFLADRAVFSRGSLVLRAGRKGAVTFGVTINFKGAQPEALEGKNLDIQADTNKSARVTLHWLENGESHRESYDIQYALRLEFGPLAGRRLPGGIYLCLPDAQKSYLMGTFNAEVQNPKK